MFVVRGHIHKRERVCNNGRRSVLWYVVVDLPRGADGKRRQKWYGGFDTKRTAEAVRARLVTQLMGGTYILPSTLPLIDWLVDEWLPTHRSRIKRSTARAYESAIRLHIAPHIGGVELGKLTPRLLNDLYQALLANGRCDGNGGLSPSTVRGVHLIIHKALQDAHEVSLIPENPAGKAKPPRPRIQWIELPVLDLVRNQTILKSVQRSQTRSCLSAARRHWSEERRNRWTSMARC